MPFCVDVIDAPAMLCTDGGVLPAASLAKTADATVAAAAILAAAQMEAQVIREQAMTSARTTVRDIEQKSLIEVKALLQVLEEKNAAILDGIQGTVLALAGGLFARLVSQMPPAERLAAALQRVLAETPAKLVSPVLRVHPDDVALLPVIDWDIKADPSLTRSSCRLEADSGEWCVSFDAAVSVLSEAMVHVAGMPSPGRSPSLAA